jgi:hypothetical protein
MPATLPATSAYTYAVELSIDEALGDPVTFFSATISKPVVFYLENYRDFSVGAKVPVGYYDPNKDAWVANPNGIVIELTGVDSSGRAIVYLPDLTNMEAVAALGMSPAERETLAQLYCSSGCGNIKLWRVPVTHFSTYDCNWPFDLPDSAEPPKKKPSTEVPECEACKERGSIIEVENQVLGEQLSLPGIPFDLSYRSNRVPGRKSMYRLNIPLTGADYPEELKAVVVWLEVAGQRFD